MMLGKSADLFFWRARLCTDTHGQKNAINSPALKSIPSHKGGLPSNWCFGLVVSSILCKSQGFNSKL